MMQVVSLMYQMYGIYIYIHSGDVYDWELRLPLTIKYLINSQKASSYINKTILNEHTAQVYTVK